MVFELERCVKEVSGAFFYGESDVGEIHVGIERL